MGLVLNQVLVDRGLLVVRPAFAPQDAARSVFRHTPMKDKVE